MAVKRATAAAVAALLVLNVFALGVFLTQPVPLALEADVLGLAYNPDGSTALLVGERGTVLRFDGTSIERLGGGLTGSLLRDVAWSPDGSTALLVGDQGTVLLYDAANGALATVPADPAHQFHAVTFLDRNTALLAGDRGVVARYDALAPARGRPLLEAFLSGCDLPGPLCPNFRGIDWQPRGDYALAVGENGIIVREPGRRGSGLPTWERLASGGVTYNDVEWKRPAGEAALLVGDDGTVRRFNGTAFPAIPVPTGVRLLAVAWKPFTSTALLAGEHGVLLQYNDFTRRVTPVTAATGRDIVAVSWDPATGGALLAADGGVLRAYPNLGLDPALVTVLWFAEAFLAIGAGAVWTVQHRKRLQRLRRRIPASTGFTAAQILDFEARNIVYQVLLRNRSTATISDIRVRPRLLKGAFALSDPVRVLALLRPRAQEAASFVLRPKGLPGELEVSAEVRYFDGDNEVYRTLRLAPVSADLRLLPLRAQSLEPEEWEEVVSRYFMVEESVRMRVPAEEAFQEAIEAVRGKDLEVVQTSTAKGKDTFTARASLFARDDRDRGFGVHLESRGIVGRKVVSSLTVRIFAEVEETLFAFYHLVYGDIEQRLRQRDESLDLLRKITEITQEMREREEGPAVTEIASLRGNLEEAFESLRSRLEREAQVRSQEEIQEMYTELAQDLISGGTLDTGLGRRRVMERLPKEVYRELEVVPEALALLSEAESSEALKVVEMLPENARKALLLVYPNALEVYLRERLRLLLAPGVTVLLGPEFGHVNTRKKDWAQRWSALSLGSCIHAIENNQYMFVADAAAWEKGTLARLHAVRDLRNAIAHPSGRDPDPAEVRDRVYALFIELPKVLKPIPAAR